MGVKNFSRLIDYFVARGGCRNVFWKSVREFGRDPKNVVLYIDAMSLFYRLPVLTTEFESANFVYEKWEEQLPSFFATKINWLINLVEASENLSASKIIVAIDGPNVPKMKEETQRKRRAAPGNIVSFVQIIRAKKNFREIMKAAFDPKWTWHESNGEAEIFCVYDTVYCNSLEPRVVVSFDSDACLLGKFSPNTVLAVAIVYNFRQDDSIRNMVICDMEKISKELTLNYSLIMGNDFLAPLYWGRSEKKIATLVDRDWMRGNFVNDLTRFLWFLSIDETVPLGSKRGQDGPKERERAKSFFRDWINDANWYVDYLNNRGSPNYERQCTFTKNEIFRGISSSMVKEICEIELNKANV